MLFLNVRSRITGDTLAQLRAVKDQVQVLSDKTNGIVTELFSDGLQSGKDKISRSSTLSLDGESDSPVMVHRYLLENGDLVRITSDGQTVILNDQILDADYKQRLLQALAEQKLTVAKKSPGVGPEAFYQPKPVDMLAQEREKILKEQFKQAAAINKQKESSKPRKDRLQDRDLDPLVRAHPKHGRKFFKNLAYLLSYGDKNA